jgi:LysR family nitrogen assimilation transcriptional regulator
LYEENFMPDLKSMQYFVQVAQLGSFSKAAEILRLTQPAVSRQVRKLEEEIGVPLLYRKGRSVAPTEAGQILLARAKELGKEANKICEDVRAGASLPSGPLAIGVANVIGQLLLPSVVSRFGEKYPNVRLHISEGYSGFVEEWLSEGRVDVGLIWGRPTSAVIDLKPMLALEMCLIAPAEPLPEWERRPLGKQCNLLDVVRLPLILPALPHALRLMAETSAEKVGRRLNIALEVDGLALTNELVKAGMGYTIMTHPGLSDDISRIRIIPIGPPRMHWVLSFATLKGTRNSAAIRELFNELLDVCEQKIANREIAGKLVKRN